jgi:serine protease inhibitor
MIHSRMSLAAVLIAAIGCQNSTLPHQVSADLPQMADSNNAFALDFYGRVRERDGNICLSPYSVWSALALTSGGARGATAEEMAHVLHLPAGDNRVHAESAKLLRELVAKGEKATGELAIANALWAQKSFPFREEFLTLGRTHYDAGLATVDFTGSADEARRTINDWVAKHTDNKIKDLIGALDGDTVLVVTNAVNFKAEWRGKFNRDHTGRKSFFLADGSTAKVELMDDTFELPYLEEEELQVVMLPYRGEKFSLAVLLPRKRDGLAALEKGLTADKLTGWLTGCKPRLVAVYLPRFQFSGHWELKGPLAALGMQRAFNGTQADFSGMSREKGLFVGDVVHQTFIDVNEEGTEAAGASAVRTIKSDDGPHQPPPRPVTFQADHPFLFLIRDNRSGTIVFLGRLTDPRTAAARSEQKEKIDEKDPPPKKQPEE